MAERSLKNRLGICRNRLPDYLKAKGRKSVTKKRFAKSTLRKNMDEDEIIESTLLNYSTKASESELTEINEPVWMGDYRRCCRILAQVEGILQDIKEEKARKLTAVNEQKHQKIIERFYTEAATKVESAEKILKSIEKGGELSDIPSERKIFANTLMSLAMKIRERAKEIRQAQQQDLQRRKELQALDRSLDAGGLMNRDEEGQELTEEGFQALEESLVNERNEEIIKIVSSIHSLNSIYKELQNVVIQQGSLLDRIDLNIETAASNVKQANEHLTKAEEHQRSPLANRVIAVLVLLIVAMTLVLALR